MLPQRPVTEKQFLRALKLMLFDCYMTNLFHNSIKAGGINKWYGAIKRASLIRHRQAIIGFKSLIQIPVGNLKKKRVPFCFLLPSSFFSVIDPLFCVSVFVVFFVVMFFFLICHFVFLFVVFFFFFFFSSTFSSGNRINMGVIAMASRCQEERVFFTPPTPPIGGARFDLSLISRWPTHSRTLWSRRSNSTVRRFPL